MFEPYLNILTPQFPKPARRLLKILMSCLRPILNGSLAHSPRRRWLKSPKMLRCLLTLFYMGGRKVLLRWTWLKTPPPNDIIHVTYKIMARLGCFMTEKGGNLGPRKLQCNFILGMCNVHRSYCSTIKQVDSYYKVLWVFLNSPLFQTCTPSPCLLCL